MFLQYNYTYTCRQLCRTGATNQTWQWKQNLSVDKKNHLEFVFNDNDFLSRTIYHYSIYVSCFILTIWRFASRFILMVHICLTLYYRDHTLILAVCPLSRGWHKNGVWILMVIVYYHHYRWRMIETSDPKSLMCAVDGRLFMLLCLTWCHI